MADMRAHLSSTVLLGLESAEKPEEPKTFSATFPAAFADRIPNHPLTADGTIEFGPYVICFSSASVVEKLSADPILGVLVTQCGRVRGYSSLNLFKSALTRKCDVLLNPFVGVTCRFSQDDIRALLADDSV